MNSKSEMLRSAEFSPCRLYRYKLWRIWDSSLPYAQFIGLNPSTADETNDDPTVRRCINYAAQWGYGGLCMTNIFAYRATDPRDMKAVAEPVGPGNDAALVEVASKAGVVVAAWGTHGSHMLRGIEVCKLIPDLHVLKLTRDGFPAHPLYLLKSLRPRRWE